MDSFITILHTGGSNLLDSHPQEGLLVCLGLIAVGKPIESNYLTGPSLANLVKVLHIPDCVSACIGL